MAHASTPSRLGISGWLAQTFQRNPLTPILAIMGLLLGLLAVGITPREEEPQIDVTMANVFVPFQGASATDVESMIATPLEQKLSEVEGVKHVYSVSRPGMAILTVEYTVGVPRQPALVRLYNQVFSNMDWLPQGMGVGQPLIKPKGIDDVPVMSLTLWSDDPHTSAVELADVAHTLETDIKRISGTRDVYTIGAPDDGVMVTLAPGKLQAFGLTVNELIGTLQAANEVQHSGERVDASGATPTTIGQFLAHADDIAELVIGMQQGKPGTLADVATIQPAADVPNQYVWHGAPAGKSGPAAGDAPAVTIAVAKKPGSNASDITSAIAKRVEQLQGELIPDQVNVTITRDYGQTATDKAQKLIKKLIFATASVVLLVLLTLGWREAIVVGSAVVLTLALTLFASWAMGFTLNRVSLFALIFSIGILVDDAIVVVENIHRHMTLGGKSLFEAIPPAVDEVGGPTILATFTVIAALMPMAFVSGLMGPYMRPIPINASVGMLLSLGIALIVTPWLSLKLLKHHAHGHDASDDAAAKDSGLKRLFRTVMTPFLAGKHAGKKRLVLFTAIVATVLLSVSLAVVQLVVLKMLPFDNKSEFQVIVDMPEGRPLEDLSALLSRLSAEVAKVPEVSHYQVYAGTAAPINFNGLVRQYFLRQGNSMGDIQVNLVDKHDRKRQSHAIARDIRPVLAALGRDVGASVKVVEVPPGPPVLSPIVAEVYGPDVATRRNIARELADIFGNTEGIVDIDTTVAASAQRETVVIDQARAAQLGISQATIANTVAAALGGMDATYLRNGIAKYPRPVRLRASTSDQASLPHLLSLPVRAANRRTVPISELVTVTTQPWDNPIHHKDLLPVSYVMADEAGTLDSPLYGMFSIVSTLNDTDVSGYRLGQKFIGQPSDTNQFAIKWDGEWQITYETFRDMGIAYAAGLVLIYLLVVAQFRSYLVPLVIMAPIPLTMIGVMPGHALLGAQFTATSMIGMIALAGIIVRNSILLVDFINQEVRRGIPLAEAVIDACTVRAKPIALTAVAAMMGAFFILDDPIFNGLAVSLIFGILVSTLLTLVLIPLLYFVLLSLRPKLIETTST